MLVGLRRVSNEARTITDCRLEVCLVVPTVRGVVEFVRVGSERLLVVLCVERHRDGQ